jgi:hypothetical protein
MTVHCRVDNRRRACRVCIQLSRQSVASDVRAAMASRDHTCVSQQPVELTRSGLPGVIASHMKAIPQRRHFSNLDGSGRDWRLAPPARKMTEICELIANDASVIQRFQSIAPGVIIVDPATAALLGAPVGGEQSVGLILEKKLLELKRLSELGRWIVAVTLEVRSMSFLWLRLNVAVQRGNAACIAGTEQWSENEALYAS